MNQHNHIVMAKTPITVQPAPAWDSAEYKRKQRKQAEVRMNVLLPDHLTAKSYYEQHKGEQAGYIKGNYLASYFTTTAYWDWAFPQAIMSIELGRGTVDEEIIKPKHFNDLKAEMAGYVSMRPYLLDNWSAAGIGFHIAYGMANGEEDYIKDWMEGQVHLDPEYKLLVWDADRVLDYLKGCAGKQVHKGWKIDYSRFLTLRPNPEPEIFNYMLDFYTRGRVGMMFYELRMNSQDPDTFDKMVQRRIKRYSGCAFATNLILNTCKEYTDTMATFEVMNEFKQTMGK